MHVGVQVPLPEEEKASLEAKPDKLAIGGDGGFQVDADKFTIEKTHTLVVLPEFLRMPLPCPDLPHIVIQAIDGVLVSLLLFSLSLTPFVLFEPAGFGPIRPD